MTLAVPVIMAMTLHEAAHGYVARYFGDDTAEKAGRISLNPLRHMDPFGTIILPALMILANTGFIFGYAKPVPVNFGKLRHPKRDMIWVAAAGPGMNVLLAGISALLIYVPVFRISAGRFANQNALGLGGDQSLVRGVQFDPNSAT